MTGILPLLKFIPVRGRKPSSCWVVFLVLYVEIYPREGTETVLAKPLVSFHVVEIYPREGTETPTIHYGTYTG